MRSCELDLSLVSTRFWISHWVSSSISRLPALARIDGRLQSIDPDIVDVGLGLPRGRRRWASHSRLRFRRCRWRSREGQECACAF
jgi:hypothetical protein